MDLGLTDKIALVTGSTSGIGKAIAETLAAEGAKVAITGQQEKKAKKIADMLGGKAAGFGADLMSAASIQTLVNDVVARFGTIHVLVNVAGGVAKFGSFDDESDEDWQKDFDLNVMSAVRVTRAALPHMRRQRWGRIINFASEDGIQPYADVPSYATSKAAILALTKSLSKLLAKDGILVNTVSPAFVMTPLVKRMLEKKAEEDGTSFDEAKDNFLAEKRPHIELKRPGEPAEIAAAVAFLASERASFILGAKSAGGRRLGSLDRRLAGCRARVSPAGPRTSQSQPLSQLNYLREAALESGPIFRHCASRGGGAAPGASAPASRTSGTKLFR